MSSHLSATMSSHPLRLAVPLLLGVTLAGCGKSLPAEGQGHGASVAKAPSTGLLAVSGTITKNTSRLGGGDPIGDAAAVALAVHPGLTPSTRAQAVVLVDRRRWPVALAAAALAGYPLQAPLLYSEGDSLPTLSAQALATLRPTGAPRLGGAQVIEIGTSAAPAGYRVHTLAGGARANGVDEDVYRVAAQIEGLVAAARGEAPRRVIVVGAEGPPALAMPAAGLAAETGSPILLVSASAVPPATRSVLSALRRPSIYVVGPPAAVSHGVLAALGRYGPVRRIDAQTGGEDGSGPVANAIGVARFKDGSFGWGVDEPGHGLVFVNATRPLDAPAAAPLSASGDYGPLLLLAGPSGVPPALTSYLSDIEPGAPEYQPVRGFYNHGWVIGDDRAITATTQAELDGLLEAVPQRSSGSSTTPSEPAEAPSSETPSSPSETSTEASPAGTSTAQSPATEASQPAVPAPTKP